jgi:pSer/pThr/pTyr-binding forkhead associated (FHA) protein
MDIERDINISNPSFEKKNYYRVKESELFKDCIEKKDKLEKDSNKNSYKNSNKNITGETQEPNQKVWEEGDKEDKVDEDGYNPTCILNEELQSPSYLLKPYDPNQYETITMSQFPFFIGKLKKNVDYCLENDIVSRYHAKITKELDGYYITDLNSTNGTFLNSESLLTYQKKALKPGDEIAFANIKYQFVVQ